MNNHTPLMKQYWQIKNEYPDTIVFFQVGDFYEIFFDDAIKVAPILGIALTQRGTDNKGNPIPLCGVPMHVLDHYLAKLVKAGFKVTVCNQLESPKPGKIVKRGVSQILTPGTLTDSKLLDEKSASYLCTFYQFQDFYTLIFAELLTGQIFITNLDDDKSIESEISRFMPSEILMPDIKISKKYFSIFNQYCPVTFENINLNVDNILLDESSVWLEKIILQNTDNSVLVKELKNSNLNSFKLCLALFYKYIKKNNIDALGQFRNIVYYNPEEFLILDSITQRNLDLIINSRDNSTKDTLFEVLDKACTAMGSRTIKKWIVRPLVKKDQIEKRLDAIEILINNINLRDKLIDLLKKVGDLERVVGRIALKRAQIHDYIFLIRTLEIVPEIKLAILNLAIKNSLLNIIESKIANFSDLYNLLLNSINIDNTTEKIIKHGFDPELDRLRDLIMHSAQEIIKLEKQEQTRTGIGSLKIKYNNIFGYSIEVTKANLDSIPEDYIRIQTLSNRERFTTQELKNLEYEINKANSSIDEIEKSIFDKIKLRVEEYIPELKKLSYSLAYLDALLSLAQVAYNNNYVRPIFDDKKELIIENGRHPVVEAKLKEHFIPNSTELNDEKSIWIITGPNMGGKSTYLRQVALICIMAQIGSFVPASRAKLFILDRIFTRIGASDNLAQGKSTFLVEMEETAVICNNATENSLLILDEVGRGTSTFDGLAIAQSVLEYINNNIKALCLFATHYHELTQLSNKHSNIALYYASSTKAEDNIVLLHKIIPGVAQGSFGLEVAKVAKLPEVLILRAREILEELNSK